MRTHLGTDARTASEAPVTADDERVLRGGQIVGQLTARLSTSAVTGRMQEANTGGQQQGSLWDALRSAVFRAAAQFNVLQSSRRQRQMRLRDVPRQLSLRSHWPRCRRVDWALNEAPNAVTRRPIGPMRIRIDPLVARRVFYPPQEADGKLRLGIVAREEWLRQGLRGL